MQQALRKALGLGVSGFEYFESRLAEFNGVVAGHWALIYYAVPNVQDWHPKTRSEILSLAFVIKQMGLMIPINCLERIGYWLQLFPLIEAQSSIPIDIFLPDVNIARSNPYFLGLEGWRYVSSEPHIFGHHRITNLWRKGNTLLFLNHISEPLALVSSIFPFQTTFQPIGMKCMANIPSFSHHWQALENHLEVYDQWRLVIANRQEFLFKIESNQFADDLMERTAHTYDELSQNKKRSLGCTVS